MERATREPIELQLTDTNVPVSYDSVKAPHYNITPLSGFSVFNSEGDVLFKGKVESVACDLRKEVYHVTLPQKKVVQPKAIGYEKKRVLPLVLILLLNVAVIVAACLGYFIPDNRIAQYMSSFVKEGTSTVAVSYIDGLVALLGYFGVSLGQTPALDYATNADTLSWAMTGVFGIAYALVLVLALVHVIVSLVALCGRKQKGVYQKRRMGWSAICMLVLTLVGLLGLAFCQGQIGFGEVASLFMLKEMTGVGIPRADYILLPSYGLYGLLGTSILTLVFTSISYGGYTGGKKC